MILDVDPDATRGSVGVQRDFSVALRELKGVLQQVPNRREQHFPVDIERKTRINITDSKTALSRTRLKRSRDFHVGNEVGEGDQLVSRRRSRCYSHVGEGLIYETPHPNQGPIQHGSRRFGYSDTAGFDGHNSKSCRLKLISQLVREESKPFIQGLDAVLLRQGTALKRVLRHGVGDPIVKTAVESSKLVCLDRRATFKCQIRYGLAEIAVVVNNLVDRESLL